MAEYLAPGVYVEETSFRSKSIEGVSTSTAGFVGLTRSGPVANPDGEAPELLTRFEDFERIYGGLEALTFAGTTTPVVNYLAHAVRAFFNEGGARLYVARVYAPTAATPRIGQATVAVTTVGSFFARSPGSGGNALIRVRVERRDAVRRALATAPRGTLLTGPANARHVKQADGAWSALTDVNTVPETVTLAVPAVPAVPAAGGNPAVPAVPAVNHAWHFVTLRVTIEYASGRVLEYGDLGLDTTHPRDIATILAEDPARPVDRLQLTHAFARWGAPDAAALLAAFSTSDGGPQTYTLDNGSDGALPTIGAFERALRSLAALDEVSIVAAPGASAIGDDTLQRGVRNALIAHADTRRAYRIAVVDPPASQTVGTVQAWRGEFDSTHAALYYPWVVSANPTGDGEIALPPSGFICGIYARSDIERAVYKAPANEVIRGAIRFQKEVSFGEQEVLNPRGINCLRTLPGRGLRVWGARTASSDPEWKYVSVRRYSNYLGRSIDNGTQWAVFEPNGERLWANVRDTISAFLYSEWRSGALLGQSAREAFFVRCDRSTMDQNDLDNGRLVCLVGVAVVKPAEFVIFRVGQKTADARS